MSDVFEIVDATGDEYYTLGVFASHEAARAAIFSAARSADLTRGSLPLVLDPHGNLDSSVKLHIFRRSLGSWHADFRPFEQVVIGLILNDDDTYRVDIEVRAP